MAVKCGSGLLQAARANRARAILYRVTHKEEKKAYYLKNHEAILLYAKTYAETHKEELKRKRQADQKNRTRRNKEWCAKNPDKVRASRIKNNATQKSLRQKDPNKHRAYYANKMASDARRRAQKQRCRHAARCEPRTDLDE